MTPTLTESRIVLFAEEGEVEKTIRDSIGHSKELVLSRVVNQLEGWQRVLLEKQPEIILLDYQLVKQSERPVHTDITVQFPDALLIMILPEQDAGLAQQVLLEGANAFISLPLTKEGIEQYVIKAIELKNRKVASAAVEQKRPENYGEFHTFVFFGPRGGVGTSTLAVNSAISLVEQSAGKVLLIDGKQYFGHVDMMLNLNAQSSLGDMISFADEMSEDLFSDIVATHTSGLDVLTSPTSFQVSQTITPEKLLSIIRFAQDVYDYIIVDAGSALNENAVTIMDAAFRIILVIDPGLASLHGARSFYELSEFLNYQGEKIVYAVNRAGAQGGLKVKQISESLGSPAFSTVPDDPKMAFHSINVGVPIIINKPKSDMAKAINELSKELTIVSRQEMREHQL